MFGESPRFLFVTNPKAGNHSENLAGMISSSLGGRAVCEIRETARAGHATQLAEEGVASGYDAVVAVGGDGTINEVGRALVASQVPMGILPAGSGNALAKCLGHSLDRSTACEQLLSGRIRSIDVGHLGEEIFLTTAGIGLDAEVCKRFNTGSGRRGIWPYVRQSLACVLTYKAQPYRLFLDEDSDCLCVCPSLLTLANSAAFGYGAEIAPGALPDDGLLDVCIVEEMTIVRALVNAHRLFNGTFDQTPGVTRCRVTRLRIEREAPGPIQVDGESRMGDASLEVTLSSGGLDVIVPA